MNRQNFVTNYFQKKDALVASNTVYAHHITQLFQWMIQADGITHDITSTFLSLKGQGNMQIISKQNGILAGIEEIDFVMKQEKNIVFSPLLSDGSQLMKGSIVAEITGDNQKLLAFERTILNIIGRMSGIATDTHQLVSSIQHIPHVPFIAATRKTPLMFLDKKAVAVGGGFTHRLSLSDEVLIKDNHLKILGQEMQTSSMEKIIAEAVTRMMQSLKEFFEIEVETLSQANAALTAFGSHFKNQKVMALLLDNFQPEDAKNFVENLKKNPLYHSVLLEASGEINQTNVSDWAKTGVDMLSLGALTHSPKNFNFSMGI